MALLKLLQLSATLTFILLPHLREQASPIQAHVGELAHLQQKLQEGWGACHLFVQHMKNTTKAFEGLIRSTGIASHHGQILREQLVQASQLAESLGRKLTLGKLTTGSEITFSSQALQRKEENSK